MTFHKPDYKSVTFLKCRDIITLSRLLLLLQHLPFLLSVTIVLFSRTSPCCGIGFSSSRFFCCDCLSLARRNITTDSLRMRMECMLPLPMDNFLIRALLWDQMSRIKFNSVGSLTLINRADGRPPHRPL